MTKIKICGIKQPELAYSAARAGADFIGLVFVPSSTRAITLQLAKIIASATREGGAEPVAVFAQSSATSMLHFCEQTDIHWVQLHGEQSREEAHLLPDTFHRIYVQPVSSEGRFNLDDAVNSLDTTKDYLLFDSVQAGSGKKFDWSHFSPPSNFPWFLSGGLNTSNVEEAIRLLHPTAVDVSSGVENAAGEKTLELIKRFIEKVCEVNANL